MLEAIGLCKKYRRQTVLDGVGFTLRPGHFVGLVGHNGSGKSTLLSILAGVLPPDAGDVRFCGTSVLGSHAFLREKVGYVPQHSGLLPDLRVDETALFWRRVYGLSGQELFSPSSVFAMFGVDALSKKRVGKLSGGERQRLSISLALMHEPAFLLLDEAFAPLDRQYRQALYGWMDGHRRRGGAVLNSSHELGEILGLCDEILVLRQGSLAYRGAAANFPQDAAALDSLLNPLPAGGLSAFRTQSEVAR